MPGTSSAPGPGAARSFAIPISPAPTARSPRAAATLITRGPIAATIEAYFRRIGGWMTRADLAGQHAEWVEPYATDYRGVTVHALGANTQGIATLQMLNMIEHFDLRGAGFQSAQSIHLAAEAKRLAYEDRARYYADPHFSRVPVEWLISKDYAAERVRLIRPDRVNPDVHPGQAPSHGDTTYFSCADSAGMMVSMIQSNFRGMGSGLVPDGLGFMFQDRGQLFSLQDGHPQYLCAGQASVPDHHPGFATRHGAPWLAFGVMGGDMQPQGQSQIIINRVDYGLDVQGAADSPRWHHEGSSQSMGEDAAGMGHWASCGSKAASPRRPGAHLPTSAGGSARRTAVSAATNASNAARAGASGSMRRPARCARTASPSLIEREIPSILVNLTLISWG